MGRSGDVERLIGMFAFAVFDRKERILALVRDRLGIKPLYWGRIDGRIAFASELKAFGPLPGFPPEIDRDALASYLCTGYVPRRRPSIGPSPSWNPAPCSKSGRTASFGATPTGPRSTLRSGGNPCP
ncbi:hypothetical protein [Methyloceanibacter stevinii]|uniref:hypothetical protein n=1 Tax=Methyloceanibacter stevinii TaxID=1774970 RepID=UPI000B0BB182